MFHPRNKYFHLERKIKHNLLIYTCKTSDLCNGFFEGTGATECR
jgi:hypothetical protein